VDSKAECDQLNLARSQKQKYKKGTRPKINASAHLVSSYYAYTLLTLLFTGSNRKSSIKLIRLHPCNSFAISLRDTQGRYSHYDDVTDEAPAAAAGVVRVDWPGFDQHRAWRRRLPLSTVDDRQLRRTRPTRHTTS